MKRIYFLFVIILLLFGCTDKHEEGQNVTISEIGSFKIPPGMICVEENEAVYLRNAVDDDENERNVLVGVKYENEYLGELSKALNKEIVYEELLSSEAFSNSAVAGRHKYTIDGVSCEKVFLDLYSSEMKLFFLVCDDTLDYDIIADMAKSFVMN